MSTYDGGERETLYTFAEIREDVRKPVELSESTRKELEALVRRRGRGQLTLVVNELVPDEDPLKDALERGQQAVQEILDRPEMLTAADFAEKIGVTAPTVNERRKRRELLALEGAKRGFRYPEWQILSDGRVVEGMSAIFEFAGPDPWSVYRFLTTPNPAFEGKRPFEALRSGNSMSVISAAESWGDGSFG